MHISTSKGASAKMRALAKKIAAHFPGMKYVSRSSRPLSKIAAIASAQGERQILILALAGKKDVLQKYFLCNKNWEWEERAMEICDVQFFSPAGNSPKKIIAGGAEGKKVAKFFSLENDFACEREGGCVRVKISTNNGKMRIFCGKEENMGIKYKWANLWASQK